MIIIEARTVKGKEYRYVYSDAGKMIAHGQDVYQTVYEPAESEREYYETDFVIETPTIANSTVDPEILAYAEAGKILMGVK